MKRLKRKKQNAGVGVNGNGSLTGDRKLTGRGVKLKQQDCGRKQKLAEIHQALISDPVDIETLRRAAATKGGLLTDELRRKVWPKLLNINVYELPYKPGRDVRENHKDYNQVLLDVRRSMKRFPKGMPATERAVLQEQLINIILEVLKHNPQLHYYQGYHDVAVTLLLVVGERMAIAMLDTLSNYHLRDFMDPTMDSTKHILNYLMPILEQVDTELHDFMIRAEVGTIFALSWLITWYGHVLSEFRHTLRLYDFFLASHPLMPIYLAATIVLHREKDVKQTECDMAMVHHLLSRIPQDLPYELLIAQSQDLFNQYPPSLLAKRAALQSRKSLSISTFQAFQLSTLHQRPDSVLQRLTKAQGSTTSRQASQHSGLEAALPRDRGQLWGKGNRMVKMAVWGLSATLGAAVFAVAQTAMDWGPEVLLQLF
ncbi:TBC1 domain family member 20-like isoform X1 [Seriola lalandi dorsalis]|uniref:TBC1 domain family member 20-like isoform X1 n=1 Tax=Seriola lalandi dorsalis TaxID=1841481 RepID=UPI000C6FB996|nr:TBC1 domain family member 20-like isoform X1 [Seriola lalandi dorsalis]